MSKLHRIGLFDTFGIDRRLPIEYTMVKPIELERAQCLVTGLAQERDGFFVYIINSMLTAVFILNSFCNKPIQIATTMN